ncbi:hypothetical protein MMC22_002648 [Lobaria immixta]|nr:hypothetical protein [Lobaria immixta]
MECRCVGEYLICGFTRFSVVQRLAHYCRIYCDCLDENHTKFYPNNEFSEDLKYYDELAKSLGMGEPSTGMSNPFAHIPNPSTGSNGAGGGSSSSRNNAAAHTCSKTCTAVNRDCDKFFTGGCKCYAPPAGPFFWFSGYCGSVHLLPKRDLAQQRRSHYLNATAQFDLSNKTPAPPGPHPDTAAQLASGLLPSPCNASYVSFACADSTDGIVHEPLQNWLGALLPEDAKEYSTPPPVPEGWLRIQGEERKSQERVAKVTVD